MPPGEPAQGGAARGYDAVVVHVEDRLRAALGRHEDVLVAYLFGSTARGTAGPMSDVDVAVLVKDEYDLAQRRLDLIGDVSSIVGSERADVVLLNEAPVSLAYRVLRDGRLIVCRDEQARVRHFVETVDRYLDMAPFREALSSGVGHRVQEGRFGRP